MPGLERIKEAFHILKQRKQSKKQTDHIAALQTKLADNKKYLEDFLVQCIRNEQNGPNTEELINRWYHQSCAAYMEENIKIRKGQVAECFSQMLPTLDFFYLNKEQSKHFTNYKIS